MISVIIPTLNEEAGIRQCIDSLLSEECGCEIIIADGGSRDRTSEYAAGYPGVKFVRSPKGRGMQMNTGAAAASGDILLFLHADTVLEKGWSKELPAALDDNRVAGGAFSFSIRSRSGKYRLVETWVALRCKICSLPYGDQAIFARKSAFDLINGYRNIPLMEDVDFVERLKKLGAMAILNKKAETSERRWSRKGFIKTTATNQLIMLLYRLGVSPATLARMYYR